MIYELRFKSSTVAYDFDLKIDFLRIICDFDLNQVCGDLDLSSFLKIKIVF